MEQERSTFPMKLPFLVSYKKRKKGKVCIRDKWPIRPALNSGFRSMKRLGILLLPPGWDASPSQGSPQHYDRRYPFVHLGEERQCGIKFSFLRKQHDCSDQARTTDL